MSKKKQPPKMQKKKAEQVGKQPEKKPVKGIIIAVAAIILVAAAVLTAVFLIKPSSNTNIETTTDPKDKYRVPGSEGYTYVDYKGAQLPQEFVDVLNQAELDSEAACKAQGVALEIGGIKISMPEFMSYYYDQYSLKKTEVQYSIEQKGMNMTGFDPEIMPDEQNCLNKGYTWAEDFTRKAIAVVQGNYRDFERALETGVSMTDDEVTYVISQFSVLETASKFQQKSIEELLEAIYGEGFTADMFKAREIMLAYKQKYEENEKQKLAEGYSDEELKKQLESNPDEYTVIVGRVYPIEGDFDAVEVSKINTEEEFLEYAKNNFPGENYNAEIRTQCNFADKKTIAETFGGEVAEWMFSDERVEGEIGLVQGQLFKYLVYIEKKPYLNLSRKIIYYGTEYTEGITEDEKKLLLDGVQSEYDAWKAGEATAESFEKMCMDLSGGAVYDVRIGDFYYSFEEWIFDDARKTGDNVLIDSDVGCGIIYYMGENEGDYDWEFNMRIDKSEEDYLAAYEKDIAENYKEDRKDSVIKKVQKEVNVIITRKLAEEKKNK